MLDHVSIQCADPAASAAFYDAVLAPVGGGRAMDFGAVIGYGIGGRPQFWIGPRSTGPLSGAWPPDQLAEAAIRSRDGPGSSASARSRSNTAV